MISELASRVFQARDVAHRAHWSANSYAVHCHLNEFYETVIGAVDDVIEEYQGNFGLIGTFDIETKPVEDITAYLREESDWIEENRDKLSQGSQAIAALVDVLVAVYLKTIYKMDNLA